MHTVITLCMDADSSDRVTAFERLLAENGISNYAADLGYKPHISLFSFSDKDPQIAFQIAAQIAASNPSFRIVFDAVCLFPGERPVLWLAPVPSSTLLSLHEKLHVALASPTTSRYFQIGQWTPHLTLAEGLTQETAAKGIAAILPVFSSMELFFDTIEVATFYPPRVVWRGHLQANDPI